MKTPLSFKDGKSDKFWRIETLGNQMMTNWGKTGTSGRYDIKVFGSVEECENQAAKLVASKKNKGYQEAEHFDENGHLYFDTDEYCPHILTSHPAFREIFSDELYYDCGDEEAPFGSDEGHDTLSILEETVKKHSNMDFVEFPKQLIENDWDMLYLPPIDDQTDEELMAQAEEKIEKLPGDLVICQSDQVILATALGQMKITGKMDPELRILSIKSLNRMNRINRLLWNKTGFVTTETLKIMMDDFEKLK